MVRRDHIVEVNERLRGGDGTVVMEKWMKPEEFRGHGRLFSMATIKPKSSIGWHQHEGEFEVYYVLEGNGIFVDNDRSRTPVGPGDVTIINVGESHAIENTSESEDLKIICLIINE